MTSTKSPLRSVDLSSFWKDGFDAHLSVLAETHLTLKDAFGRFVSAAADTVQGGGKVMFFGNGGSAADAQHLATELAVRYARDRAPIAGLALSTDTSALTAIGNDFGFDHLFSRQIEALGRKGDMAVGLSTSGNSPNILAAADSCKRMGITFVGFTGKTGGKLASFSDILINVPSTTTARIQEMHILLGHMFCAALEVELGLLSAEPLMKTA